MLILGGAGKGGMMCCYEAMKRVGPTGNVVALVICQEDADLLCDGYEYDTTSGTLVERDPVIVAAGGASVEDSVITGSMNYFVAGVEDAN